MSRLTDAQREVLRMVMMRMTAKEMAVRIGISPAAVEARLKAARQALGVATSPEAARLLAVAEGLPTYGPTISGPSEIVATPPPGTEGAPGERGAGSESAAPVEDFPRGRPTIGPAHAFSWPFSTEGRPRNDVSFGWRLAWPIIILAGLLVGTGILVSSITALSELALSLFGHR